MELSAEMFRKYNAAQRELDKIEARREASREYNHTYHQRIKEIREKIGDLTEPVKKKHKSPKTNLRDRDPIGYRVGHRYRALRTRAKRSGEYELFTYEMELEVLLRLVRMIRRKIDKLKLGGRDRLTGEAK